MSLCSTVKAAKREILPKQRKPVPPVPEGAYFDLYYWSPDEDADFHAKALKPPRKPLAGVAWAETPGNDSMFREDWIPKPYRVPGLYSTRGFLEALESKKQKEIVMHEVWGHMMHGWRHEEGHPVMDGMEDGTRVKLGERVTDPDDFRLAWNELVDRYPNVRIIDWDGSMTWEVIDADDPR